MFALLCVAFAHRASQATHLKADRAAEALVDENSVLGHFEKLKSEIPFVVSNAMKTMKSAFYGEKAALDAASAETGHKFSFLLDNAQKQSVADAMAAMKALNTDASVIEHDVGVTMANIQHHMEQSPTSFLQDDGLTDDDIMKHWDHFKEVDGKVGQDVAALEQAVKHSESDTAKVLADLHRRHDQFKQEQADAAEKARSMERKRNPTSFAETPRDWKKEEAEFKKQFNKMDAGLKKDLDAMKPHKKRSKTSLLETQPTYADLSSEADDLQKQMQQDVDDLQPDTPDIVGPDAGRQASEWQDETAPPVESLPTSLLQRNPDEDAYAQRMIKLGEQTSWAQLKQRAHATAEKAKGEKEAFEHPSSFVQIGADGQLSMAQQAAQQEMAERRATMAQITALQRKTKSEVHDTESEISKFTAETNAEIAELKVPHTSIAQALARARAHASSFLETNSAGLNAVDQITATSQFDALQALHQRTQAQEQEKLQAAMKFGQEATEKASLLQEVSSSGAAAQKQAAEQKLEALLGDLHVQLDALHGEVGGPSSFLETGGDDFDALEARLQKLQGSVSSHLSELQSRAGGAVASSFAEIHEDINMAVKRAAARQRTLDAARQLRAVRGDDDQAPDDLATNETAQYLKFEAWHKKMQEQIAGAQKANALSAKIFGAATPDNLRRLKEKAKKELTKEFGERGALEIVNAGDNSVEERDDAGEESLLQTGSSPYAAQVDASLDRQAALNSAPTDQKMKEALESLEGFEGKIGKFPETFGKEFKKEVLDKIHRD
jgi:hypothetical protein